MLKLTGGQFKGQGIETPTGKKTRPSQAKLRAALFNALSSRVSEAAVLDLFSGSGALGFEAISRGAERVVFVESDKQASTLIRRNAARLGCFDQIQVIAEPLEKCWFKVLREAPFDLVIADPPYFNDWITKLIQESNWERVLKKGGLFFLEVAKKELQENEPAVHALLEKIREKNYGDSTLLTFERKLSP